MKTKEEIEIDAMVDAYEKRLVSQANGVAGSPLVTMCLTSYKHGLQDAISEQKLANSCKSCKDSQPLQIEKGKWYMCLRSQKGFVKGCCYKSNMDKCLEGDNAYMYVGTDLGDFRLATEEEIKVNNGGISVDIDKMCYEYISNLDSLLLDPKIIAHKKYSYRQGILDTLELIKIGWL